MTTTEQVNTIDNTFEPHQDEDETKSVATTQEKTNRVNLSKILGINISQSRCDTQIRQFMSNPQTETELKAVRLELKTLVTTDPRYEEVKQKERELAGKCVRVSVAAPVATALIWDDCINEIIKYTLDNAIAARAKIAEVEHLHSGTPSTMKFWPLFNNCKIWKEYDFEFEKSLKVKKREQTKLNKKSKSSAELTSEPTELSSAQVTSAQTEAPATDATSSQIDVVLGSTEKVKYGTYIEAIVHQVKESEAYKTMRVSTRLREYLSDLVAQGVNRMCSIVQILITFNKIKTVNYSHFVLASEMLMADGGQEASVIREIVLRVGTEINKLERFLNEESHRKAQKKTSSMTEEARAAQEAKQIVSDFEKKQRQIANAEKRAKKNKEDTEKLKQSIDGIAALALEKKAMLLAQATPSQATPSQATSSQATSSQATSSQA